MFFDISKYKQKNYLNHYRINKLFLSCDDGWQHFKIGSKDFYFKGYILDCDLVDALKKFSSNAQPRYKGNFVCIIGDGKTVTITHDINRSFHVFLHKDKITNLQPGTFVGSNVYIELDNNLNYKKNCFKNYKISKNQIPYIDGLQLVHNHLLKTFNSFVEQNRLPIKIFLSKGIDTTLAYSYLKQTKAEFEVIKGEHLEPSKFYKKNKKTIQNFWAYKQIHTWQSPTVLVTGSCGDEYMMRNPETIKKYFDTLDIDILKLLQQSKQAYHYKYFNRQKNIKILQKNLKKDKNIVVTKMQLFQNMANDHQHWHIDNTLFFTPFKDLQLANLIMQLPTANLIQQALDAQISKDLIRLNGNADLQMISTYKNH